MINKIFDIIVKIVRFVRDRFYDVTQIIKMILLFFGIWVIALLIGAKLGLSDYISSILGCFIFILILYLNRNFYKIKI